ncbi:MAG: hypothetical protein ACK55I_07090, partial [bacterium]
GRGTAAHPAEPAAEGGPAAGQRDRHTVCLALALRAGREIRSPDSPARSGIVHSPEVSWDGALAPGSCRD